MTVSQVLSVNKTEHIAHSTPVPLKKKQEKTGKKNSEVKFSTYTLHTKIKKT